MAKFSDFALYNDCRLLCILRAGPSGAAKIFHSGSLLKFEDQSNMEFIIYNPILFECTPCKNITRNYLKYVATRYYRF